MPHIKETVIMNSRPIVAPTEIFRRFCQEYRSLKPRQRISLELAATIDTIIDDICNGREIRAYLEANPFQKMEPAPDCNVRCSKELLFFFDFLCRAMHEQGIFHLTPTRACEMLYGPHQDVLTLEREPHQNLCYLVSTGKYESGAGVQLKLTLGTANDATDWTPLPQGWDNLSPSPYEFVGNNDDDDDDDGGHRADQGDSDDDDDPDDHGDELPSMLRAA